LEHLLRVSNGNLSHSVRDFNSHSRWGFERARLSVDNLPFHILWFAPSQPRKGYPALGSPYLHCCSCRNRLLMHCSNVQMSWIGGAKNGGWQGASMLRRRVKKLSCVSQGCAKRLEGKPPLAWRCARTHAALAGWSCKRESFGGRHNRGSPMLPT
jgi:hypothetical protein